MADNNRGLGSDNMSQTDKDKIHSMGGKASHAGSSAEKTANQDTAITNHSGGGALDKKAQSKGGKNSQSS